MMFSQDHIPEMGYIEQQCFSVPWSFDMLKSELENPFAKYFCAVDTAVNNSVLGYIGLHIILDEGYITNIAVRPDKQRLGIARALLKYLFDLYGSTLSFITLEVRESNCAARSLYSTFGFAEKGRRKLYYDKPREDALIMTKYL